MSQSFDEVSHSLPPRCLNCHDTGECPVCSNDQLIRDSCQACDETGECIYCYGGIGTTMNDDDIGGVLAW